MQTTADQRRVVLYGRVSLDRNDTKSVDDQLAELQHWAERERWQIVGTYRDDGISASRFANGRARPGWQRAMDDIDAGKVDALLVWNFSRASRDDKVTVALKTACIERGVQIGYGGMLRDPRTADGSFYVGLDGLVAAKYSAELSETTRRGKAFSAAAGKPAGTVPFGYKRVIDPETGKAKARVEHPQQAPIVQEIVRRMLARESMDAIAVDLNQRGIPTATGKAWRAPNLAKLARRPTYAGLRTYQGEILEGVRGDWPALISEADHYALVTMHRDPSRDKFRNPTHVKHLGSGIYGCGRDCGGVMRIVVARPDRPTHYDCRTCHRVSRDQAKVDEAVQGALIGFWSKQNPGEWVKGLLAQPDVLELLAQAEGNDGEAKEAAAEVRRLTMKLKAARQAWDDDRLSLEEYAEMRDRTLPKIQAAEERARPRTLPPVVFDVAGDDAPEKWKALDITEKRSIIAALLEVTILPVGRGPQQPTGVRIEWKTSR